MRIGISGGPGIGKTLLAQAVQRQLRLPLIDEGVRDWLASEGLASITSVAGSAQAALQRRFLRWKIDQEHAAPRFVSDRTVVDGVVIATMRLGVAIFRDAYADLYREARQHADSTYGMIVIPPPVFSLEQDPFRIGSTQVAGREHRAIGRLARCWRVPVLRLQGRSLEGWISQVADATNRTGAG